MAVITDGEQIKPSFATYSLAGLKNLAPDGVVIPFADGHARQLPKLTGGPFAYGVHASSYLRVAKRYATRPVKQAGDLCVGAEPAVSDGWYFGLSGERFLQALLDETERDIRECSDAGADSVQIDFTQGRLSPKLNPSAWTGEIVYRPEQSRAGAILDQRAKPYWSSHVSRR